MALNISTMLKRLQVALNLSDQEMADYLMVSLSAFKEARAGKSGDDLPTHATADLLDTLGFVKLGDLAVMILPKRSREKLKAARARRALTIAQQNALKKLKKQLQDEYQQGRTGLAS